MTEVRWTREHAGAYFSDCGRYCIQDMRPACEVGPWVVTHDPEGRRTGIAGRMIVRHADTLRQAKADVAAHIEHGEDWWHHIPYGHIRTDGPAREQLKQIRRDEADYWAQQLPVEGIDLAELVDSEWVRDEAVRIIRATFTTEAAAKRIVAELVKLQPRPHPVRAVIAAGICEWDDKYADWEGEDLADVALEALASAGYVVVKERDR